MSWHSACPLIQATLNVPMSTDIKTVITLLVILKRSRLKPYVIRFTYLHRSSTLFCPVFPGTKNHEQRRLDCLAASSL